MRKITMPLAVACAFALSTATTFTAAAATPDTAASAHSTNCATGLVTPVPGYTVPIRTVPSDPGQIVETAQPGSIYSCTVDRVLLGRRYTACGVTDGTGWLELHLRSGLGYAPNACFDDV